MRADGSQVVEGVVVASEADWLDVVDLGGLPPAPDVAALAMVALEDDLSDALPSAIVPMGTRHLPTPYLDSA
jgi:hypothetical protein